MANWKPDPKPAPPADHELAEPPAAAAELAADAVAEELRRSRLELAALGRGDTDHAQEG